jgi:hypothetical protein
MKWKIWIKYRSKRMNDGGNFCEITKTIMARSESRNSTCKYKDGNGEMDEEWYASEAEQCSKVLTRNEASELTGYLQTGALDR